MTSELQNIVAASGLLIESYAGRQLSASINVFTVSLYSGVIFIYLMSIVI